jgi:diguanylate cyclase (GGDEF)-like protein
MEPSKVNLFRLFIGAAVIAIFVAGISLSLLISRSVTQLAVTNFMDDIQTDANDYRYELEPLVINNDIEKIVNVIDRISLATNINYASLDLDGKTIESSFGHMQNQIDGNAPAPSIDFGDQADSTLYLSLPMNQGKVDLLLGFDEISTHNLIDSIRSIVFTSLAAASVFLIVFFTYFARYLRKKILVLVTMADQISSGESATVDVDLNIDELENLKNTMLSMEMQLNERQSDMRYFAGHDVLTKIPNRRTFNQKLDQSLKDYNPNKHIALLLMDINRFKQINDTYGHPFGDRVIRYVAVKLKRSIPADSMVARIGGDEYAIITHYENEIELDKLCRYILRQTCGFKNINDISISIAISIGVATITDSREIIDIENFISRADMALYNSKFTNILVSYHDDKLFQKNKRFSEIIRSIKQGEYLSESHGISMHYQPKYRLDNGEIMGVEALVRWDHPKLGYVEAQDIIEAAIQCSLLDKMTRKIVDIILKEKIEWRKNSLNIKVAINISPAEITNKEFFDYLVSQMKKLDVSTCEIELEITENTILENNKEVYDILQRYKEEGFDITIDDFGVGYANFRNLRNYPFSTIKIDRAFISEIMLNDRDKVLVQATTQIAHEMGMIVIAEGLENKNCIADLIRLGCDGAQGILLSPAVDAETILSLYQTNHVHRIIEEAVLAS